MSWDESLFRVGLNGIRWLGRKTRGETEFDLNRVPLVRVERRLKMLASALSGEAIELKEAEMFGGYSGKTLFLPAAMDLFPKTDANLNAYVFRMVYSLATRELGLCLPGESCDVREQILKTVEARPAVEEWLRHELPRSLDLLDQVYPHARADVELIRSPEAMFHAALENPQDVKLEDWPCLKLFGVLLPARKALAGRESGEKEYALESLASGTEKKAMRAIEHATEVKLGEQKVDENPLVHSFEKVHTAEEYQGGKKTLDGSDELADHSDALDELNLRHVIRSRERTASVYRADFALESGAPDLVADDEECPGLCHYYKEWDEKKKQYRHNWCRVYSRSAPIRPLSLGEVSVDELISRHKRQAKDLRDRMLRMVNEREWKSRQLDGPEIDLDAVVDHRATILSGHSGSGRLYLVRRRARRDVATLILLDLSLSTDSWIEDQRVLDISRESVMILTEVLEGLHDKTAIGGFFSNTRRDCRYQSFKDFDEPWSRCRSRLASAQPTGYTRIGPALRHATTLLKQVQAKQKLLLLLSDGKPTDYDRYEGRYGIADVKQAIREAAQAGVKTRALAIDSQAKFYLPQMFGHGNYQILAHPTQLAECLTRIYGEVLS